MNSNNSPKLKIEDIIPNLRVHTILGSSIIASFGYRVYKNNGYSKTWKFCNELPVQHFKRILSKNRLASRLFRTGISQIKKIFHDKLIICCDKNLFLSDLSFSYFEKIDLPINSFQFLDHSICTTREYVYYGEYFPNLKREKVNIFRSKNGLDWETIYSFPKTAIKHIHVLQYDAYSNKIWFSTGDSDRECIMGFADQNFSDLTIIGKDSQKWRTLEFVFDKDKVLWGMDAPSLQNKLLSYDRENEIVEEIYTFNGPIYNVKKLDKGYLIGTAVEGGKGEWDNKSRLWYSSNLYDWKDCINYQKDIFPYIFGFGRLLISDNIKDRILFSGLGLKEIDNKLLICSLNIE